MSKLSSIPNLNDFDNENMPNPINSFYHYIEDLVIQNKLLMLNHFHYFIVISEALMLILMNCNCFYRRLIFRFMSLGSQNLVNKSIRDLKLITVFQIIICILSHQSRVLALYICNSVMHNERSDLSYVCDDFEAIWVEIENKDKNVLCSCIYRHPSSDPRKLRKYLESIFLKISNESKLVFYYG